MEEYSPDEVDVLAFGVPLTGFADGEFITVEFLSPAFTSKVGSDGKVVHSRTSDRRAKIVIKLMSSSPSNDLLSAVYTADQLARNGAGVGAFMLKDNSGRSLYTAAEVRIMKHPDVAFDREAGAREWELEAAELIPFTGGN